MLFYPFEPRRLAFLRQARCLATRALSVGLIGVTSATWAQASTAAEEAIKKALQGGQLDRARQLVQAELKNAPQAVQWRFMEGVVQAQQGQIDKAIETFKQIIQTHPDHSEAYNNLGVLYASKGELEASKTYLEKALQTHPSYAAAHRNLSDVHSQLAKQSYAKALQVDPKAKSSAPQLTLLGSMGSPQRVQPPAQNVASLARPAASAEGPASGQAPTPASAAAPAAPAAPASPPTGAAASVPSATTVAKATTSAPAAAPTAPASASAPAKAAAPAKPSPTVAAAAPAAAPTSPPAATPAADARQADRAAIDKAVRDWAKAWSNKDMPRYYAAYGSNFTPANRASRAQWESDRRIRIVSKKSISVEVREMKVSFTGETASVRFQQLYTSDNLKGSSRKTLEMVRQGNRWLIVRESVN